jgi:hypothetical protein
MGYSLQAQTAANTARSLSVRPEGSSVPRVDQVKSVPT